MSGRHLVQGNIWSRGACGPPTTASACMCHCVPSHWLFPSSLQVLMTSGHQKVQTNTMKAYRRQQQYVYCHCQLRCVTCGNALVMSVCISMLPMVQLSAEYVQLATKYQVKPINHLELHHMYISHTPLVLFSLNNLLPAMILQNCVVGSCALPTSSHFNICCILNLSSGLGRRMVGVVFAILLLLSGDIETNPGPVGELS